MFFLQEEPKLDNYLALDDSSIISLLPFLECSSDDYLSDIAKRLRARNLYKCIDVGAHITHQGSDKKARFRKLLRERAEKIGLISKLTLLQDEPRVTGYDWYSWEDESTLKKVLISGMEHNENIDIGDRSEIVKALKQEQFYRVYVPDNEARKSVETIWAEVVR